ncbi:MAG: hypothetical protein HPY73_02985 [Methanomassiliicoccales archaeon]|nr:MAG: hypothetical protein HPY73_02985 [Methanomassiliicoccales archaeon]
MEVVISDAVKELIGKRGMKVADVEDVVKNGKAIQKKGTNHYLAQKKIGDVTAYVEYELESGILKKKANVKTAYSHRVKLVKVDHLEGESDWVYGSTPMHYATLQMEYMTVVRSGPGLASPDGSLLMAEEYLATKTLAAAEGLFEKKRA